MFNYVKSELKIIESGMKKKALIAQDFGIYKELIEDGKTGLLVKNDKKDWYRHMKKLIDEPEYRIELAENLHEYVKDKYEITNVTANRVEFYKNLVKEKSKNKEFAEAK
jgi:glycosyltransferase involved in cell wall biosynthesis